jgi:cell wall-associated NlpC family hydrolase
MGSGSTVEIVESITAGTFTRPLSGAISLELTCRDADPRRPLQNSRALTSRFYAQFSDVNFDGMTLGKSGPNVTIGFVDSIAAALSRATGLLTIPAGTQTRQQIATRLCREVGVEIVCDPAERGVVNSATERKADGDSWQLLGQLADDAGWRRFSDGRRVYFGSDAWLAGLSAPTSFREFTGPCHTIDYKLDVMAPANACTLDVDAELWAVPAGQTFTVDGLGLASGDWTVAEFKRDVFRTRATVTGTRRQLVIPEAPPEQTSTAGESGEVNFVPDAGGVTAPPAGTYGGTKLTGVQTANAATIVRVALQRGTGRRGAIVGLMTGLQESGLVNLAGGDRDSVGVFQQRASWGTTAQRRNVEWAAGAFYSALVKVSGWQTLDYTVAAQKVQISAYPTAYAKWQGTAEALYAAIAKAAGGTTSSSTSSGTALDRVADEAVKLAQRGMPYVFGGKTLAGLDCSGFVSIATRNAGRELKGGSKQQIAAAQKAGVGCTVAEALRTRGAVLFRGSTEPSHIAISLGDGRTAEARGTAQGVGVFTGASGRVWTAGAKWAA